MWGSLATYLLVGVGAFRASTDLVFGSNSSDLAAAFATSGPFQCPRGDTSEPDCTSICRHLSLTSSHKNGHCDEIKAWFKRLGYGSSWKSTLSKVFMSSYLDPVFRILKMNAPEETAYFYIGNLRSAIKALPDDKRQKYREVLEALAHAIEDWRVAHPAYPFASLVTPGVDDEDAHSDGFSLPACTSPVEEGDIVTFEIGGPDFSEISNYLSETAARSEALQVQKHFSYGNVFDYKNKFEYEELDGKVGSLFRNMGKTAAEITITAGKGLADMTVKLGKGIADVTINAFKQLGRGFVYTGSGITAFYAAQRQTTSSSGSTKWTHTEVGVGSNSLAASAETVYIYSACGGLNGGRAIISRFRGDGTVHADSYRKIVAERARLWQTYLHHYADTVGQWHRVVLGKCLERLGNAGRSEYWQAVTDEKVKEIWDYVPTDGENDDGFWAGVTSTMGTMADPFRTHDWGGKRVKPKAMFCSKFVAALWSSAIGNPTQDPAEPVRHKDVNKMLPFNPGACSPWTMVQWLTGKHGRQYWDSCIAEPYKYNPCYGAT